MSNVEEDIQRNDVTGSPQDLEKPEGATNRENDFSWRTNTGNKTQSQRDQRQEDDVSGCSVQGDICRICHMGGFPPLVDNQPMWEWQNQTVRNVSSQISTLSSYAYLGPLISACKCRGSVGLVHAECLERWLTESGHTRCELCGHKYFTKRVPRHGILTSVGIWFKTVVATRQMVFDLMYLVVTTPLALFSCYICALALRVMLENGFYDIPWMIIAMLPTCSLTLVAYWGWLITLGRKVVSIFCLVALEGLTPAERSFFWQHFFMIHFFMTHRLHSRRWRRFWRNNFVVRLLPNNSPDRSNQGTDNRAIPPISIVVSLAGNASSEEIARENEAEEFLRIM